MRILFVHEVNYRRKVVYEIHDFPELLSLRGHDVTFIDFPEGEDPGGLRRLLDLRTVVHSDQARAHPGAQVHLRTPGRVLRPPLDRLLASITHVPAIRRVLRHQNVDVVVLYGVPTNGWQTVLLARRYGVPVVFRAIDISHELRATVYRRLIHRAETFICRRADAVSTNNVALRDYVIAAGADPGRVTVEYPGLDLERFRPGPRDPELARRFGIDASDRVVLFMGTLFRFAGLGWFLDGFADVLRRDRSIKVLLVGGGEAEAELRAQVDRLGISSQVIFTGFIDYEWLRDHVVLGDVAINPFDEELVTNCALPGKILQYAGCGLPTVCTRLEGMQGVIPEGEGVTYRAPGTPFVEAVEAWLADDADRWAAAHATRRAVEERCQWTACATAMEQVIERVVTASSGRRLAP